MARNARDTETTELGLPGAFEGETVSRRRFMTRTVHAAGAVAAAGCTLPVLGFAAGPVFDRPHDTWQDIGPLDDFVETTYKPVVFTIVPGIGLAGESLAYVRRHDPQLDGPVIDQYDHMVAISDRCAHVGCPVRYVAAAESFGCPYRGAAAQAARPVLHAHQRRPRAARPALQRQRRAAAVRAPRSG